MIIAVSGNVGSGKTILSHYLSTTYNLSYVPQKRLEFDFLDDFFSNIESYFLPAQLSFLVSKAVELQDLLKNNKNIVMDRSLLEDIDVFARLWIENRNIDQRIVRLFRNTAEFIYRSFPKPDFYIFCCCPADICKQRISNRDVRTYERKYPLNHIEMLEKYYEDFRKNIDAPCVEIDTLQYDFTQQEVISEICNIIFKKIQQEPSFDQLSMFDTSKAQSESQFETLPGVVFHNFDDMFIDNNQSFQFENKQKPYIYLAAPFTQKAPVLCVEKTGEFEELNLFSSVSQPEYGRLDEDYQKVLLKIERSLIKQCSMKVHLPHRDINNWGKKNYSTEYLTPKIINHVSKASALVAIPGNSIGVHLELGIAIEKKIPIIIFDTDDFKSSFFVSGFQELPFVKYIKVSSLSEIPKVIVSEKIKSFIVESK